MTARLNVVAVNGSTATRSRSAALNYALLEALGQRFSIGSHFIHLADIAEAVGSTFWRDKAPESVEKALQHIESADLLIVATPVYRASYPGLLKHLFDLVDQDGLIGKPVLLAATGGSPYHALVLEHQLRPLFSFFQSLTLPVGVYGTDAEFTDYQVTGSALKARVELAVERAVPILKALAVERAAPALKALARA